MNSLQQLHEVRLRGLQVPVWSDASACGAGFVDDEAGRAHHHLVAHESL
jgi:hypothetical protein